MDMIFLQKFLGWNLVFHFGLLLLWAGMFKFASSWMHKMHSCWGFQDLSKERFTEIHYLCIAIYKFLVFVFVLVPYLTILIVK